MILKLIKPEARCVYVRASRKLQDGDRKYSRAHAHSTDRDRCVAPARAGYNCSRGEPCDGDASFVGAVARIAVHQAFHVSFAFSVKRNGSLPFRMIRVISRIRDFICAVNFILPSAENEHEQLTIGLSLIECAEKVRA